jgi:hypothetical protein
MTPDQGNAIFEAVGALSICWNIRQVLKDKQIKGMHWFPLVFFFSWGVWNTYFYASIEQWWSWVAGIALAIANLVWISLVGYYFWKNKHA